METRLRNYYALKKVAESRLVSGLSEYASDRSLLTFICPDTGKQYKSTAFDFYQSENKSNRGQFVDEVIKQATESFGDYFNYDHVDGTITSDEQSMEIWCPEHGQLFVNVGEHRNGHEGCDHCKVEHTVATVDVGLSKFIIEASHKHKFKYRYDNIEWAGWNAPITIPCSKHGPYVTTPPAHINNGVGCPICDTSKPRLQSIMQMLSDNGIEYSTERTFAGCCSELGRALRFDIFVPQKNLCIEFDSVHHYQPTRYSKHTSEQDADIYFNYQQDNDKIKDQYCHKNNIGLIRIPYTEFNPAQVVENYIANIPDQRVMYTWNDFKHDIECVINYIKSFNYGKFAVYGVSRGGVPFSVHVSNHMEGLCEYGMVGYQRYDGADDVVEHMIDHPSNDIPIFVIDDLTSSGITMAKVVQSLSTKFPNVNIHPIVIFGSPNEYGIFYIRNHPKQWIVFPYEI